MKSERNIALNFFIAALLYLLLAAALGVLMIVRQPASVIKVAHAHLALTGWVSLTIIGAMYQIVPTLLGRKLYSRSLAKKQFWLANIGILGIGIGFIKSSTGILTTFGLITLASFCLFAFIIYRTMSGAKLELTLRFFACSIFYLLCAAMLGTLITSGVLSTRATAAHAALGSGWISATIIGAMYQMFPMLSMREVYSRRIASFSFWFVNPGIVGFAAGVLLGIELLSRISAAAFALGYFLFACTIFMTLSKKVKIPQQKLNPSIKYFTAAIIYSLAAVASCLYFIFKPPVAYQVAIVHVAALGFVTITIIGAMYHLVPMLAWIDRYAGEMGQGKVPTTKEMFSERLEEAIFYAFNTGLVGFLAALLMQVKLLQLLFGSVIIATLASFAYAMLSIIIRR